MSLELMKEKGVPLDEQTFTWRDIVATSATGSLQSR